MTKLLIKTATTHNITSLFDLLVLFSISPLLYLVSAFTSPPVLTRSINQVDKLMFKDGIDKAFVFTFYTLRPGTLKWETVAVRNLFSLS